MVAYMICLTLFPTAVPHFSQLLAHTFPENYLVSEMQVSTQLQNLFWVSSCMSLHTYIHTWYLHMLGVYWSTTWQYTSSCVMANAQDLDSINLETFIPPKNYTHSGKKKKIIVKVKYTIVKAIKVLAFCQLFWVPFPSLGHALPHTSCVSFNIAKWIQNGWM